MASSLACADLASSRFPSEASHASPTSAHDDSAIDIDTKTDIDTKIDINAKPSFDVAYSQLLSDERLSTNDRLLAANFEQVFSLEESCQNSSQSAIDDYRSACERYSNLFYKFKVLFI